MIKRKLLIVLALAGVAVAVLGPATRVASAEQRTLLVTLLGGAQMTVTVDVPPGTPVDQIKIPGVTTPIVSVQDITPQQPAPAPPAQQPAQDPAPTTSTTEQPTKPSSSSGKDDSSSTPTQEPKAAKQVKQETTGKVQKSQPPVEPEKKTTDEDKSKKAADRNDAAVGRQPDGTPTPANPTFSEALPGPAPIGVPNFFIDKFRIPLFLLPIYQAAGIEYGVRWEVLAAINEIETDYGRNLNVSTAGAVGWMQFLPSTWKRYGVDANHDGRKDPYNPVDAIFSAARYLKAADAQTDVRQAIFAYNHADWYVDSVLMRASLLGGMPADLVGSLTGLTQGHFPVHAKARYADDISERDTKKHVKKGQNAAYVVQGSSKRRGINIFAKAGSPVIAVQDGKIVRMGHTKRLGKFIQLRDVYGNTYTYAHLKKLAAAYPVPKEKSVTQEQVDKELHLAKTDPKPTAPASAGRQVTPSAKAAAPKAKAASSPAATSPQLRKERVFANPDRPAAYAAGGEEQLLSSGLSSSETFKSYFTGVYGLKRSDVTLHKLKPGSKVIAGTILGRIGRTEQKMAPHMLFEVRPAGRDAPRIDPKPILDGWKLLESTAIYRAAGKNPFWGPDAKNPSIGQVLLMSKEALQHRVLTDSRIDIYDCGRRDIKAGGIDRRVLATLEFLAASGLKPTVSTLHCGHSYLTSSGNVSEHSSGNAVDIAAINGIPILGHQGPGSITDITIRRLLTLQGTMKPHQIISLMTFEGADNTLSLPDHADHIHVGFQPLFGTNAKLGKQLNSVLKPGQWLKLIGRLGKIENPTVPTAPSKYAIKVPKRASKAHVGE
jgi:Transglycosylase SLT domain/Peptidase family M23